MTDKHDDAAFDLLVQEVDEELRHEQMNRLWKKYANLFIAASIALVAAVAGWQAWQAWQLRQRQAASDHFAQALSLAGGGKGDEAAAALAKLAADGPAGYRTLAELKQAELRLAAGDAAGAAALYHTVANGNADKLYRDLALLKACYLELDIIDPARIEKLVEPLTQESSPWRHSAREITALAALRKGDAAAADELFRKLADDIAAPQGVRARAAEMLAARQPKGQS